MSALRTLLAPVLFGAVLAIPTSGMAAAALPYSPSQRAELFANCAGRLSALEEHQRMFDGPASEQTQEVVRLFEALLDAVMPDALEYGMPGRMVWSWRVNAKQAQSMLLTRMTFGQDDRSAALATQASARYIEECEGIVLGA